MTPSCRVDTAEGAQVQCPRGVLASKGVTGTYSATAVWCRPLRGISAPAVVWLRCVGRELPPFLREGWLIASVSLHFIFAS